MDEKRAKSLNSSRGLSGLKNIGNTCYMNSTLQALFSCDLLNIYLYNGEFKKSLRKNIIKQIQQKYKSYKELNPTLEPPEIKKNKIRKHFKNTVIYNLRKLFQYMWGINCIIEPITFKNTLKSLGSIFGGHEQQDAQEFLQYIFNRIETETMSNCRITRINYPEQLLDYVNFRENGGIYEQMNYDKEIIYQAYKKWASLYEKSRSAILDIFTGLLLSEVICMECTDMSFTFEPFSVLQLQITSDNTSIGFGNIIQCLRDYTKKEDINDYECTNCKKKTHARKRLSIWKVPVNLVIQLKRFKNDRHHISKISHKIDFPLVDLCLNEFMPEQVRTTRKYELYSVIKHMGPYGCGHYTSVSKNLINNQWYEFDDNRVKLLHDPTDYIINSESYILFYKSNIPIIKEQQLPYSTNSINSRSSSSSNDDIR